MNPVVIEHVRVAELPQAWREQLDHQLVDVADARVTVRIEAEQTADAQTNTEFSDDPLFGMWRDREDMADVQGYIRSIRAPRLNGAGGTNES